MTNQNPFNDFINTLIIPQAQTDKDISVNDILRNTEQAFRDQFRAAPSTVALSSGIDLWVMEIYADYVIACENGQYYKVSLIIDKTGKSVFGERSTWIPVKEEKLWLPMLKEKRDAETTLKHLAGQHAQKRHGWRFGSSAKPPKGQGKAELAEYKKRVAARSGKHDQSSHAARGGGAGSGSTSAAAPKGAAAKQPAKTSGLTLEIDPTKNAQAIEIIAAQIVKIPANTPMDYGTLGSIQGLTKRQGEARSMAQYFVGKLYGWKDMTPETTFDYAEKTAVLNDIINQAVAKVGK